MNTKNLKNSNHKKTISKTPSKKATSDCSIVGNCSKKFVNCAKVLVSQCKNLKKVCRVRLLDAEQNSLTLPHTNPTTSGRSMIENFSTKFVNFATGLVVKCKNLRKVCRVRLLGAEQNSLNRGDVLASDSQKKSHFNFNFCSHKTQTGRSLIEMLGVLAIMAIITVLSIMAYTMGMRNVKMNHLKNDIGTIQQQIKSTYFKRSYTDAGWAIGTDKNFQSLLVTPGFYNNDDTPFGGKYELSAGSANVLKIIVGTTTNPIKAKDCAFIAGQESLKTLNNIVVEYNCDDGTSGDTGDTAAISTPTDLACISQYGKACSSMTPAEAKTNCLANGDAGSCAQYGATGDWLEMRTACWTNNNYNACSAIPSNNHAACDLGSLSCGGATTPESNIAAICHATRGTNSSACKYLVDNPQYIDSAATYRSCAVGYGGSGADRNSFCQAIIDNSVNGTPGDDVNKALTDVCALGMYYSAQACATLRAHPELCYKGLYASRLPGDIAATCN